MSESEIIRHRLDITTTATLRPAILGHTYATFTQRLFRPEIADYRCVLNVDPIGEELSPEIVINVARQFFPDTTAHVAEIPNFASALKWCWSNTQAEYVFNLEDDWEMLKDVDLSDMLAIMDENPTLAHLRLSMFPAKLLPEDSVKGSGLCLRQWNRYIPWNGRFFEVPPDKIGQLGYSGHPSLMRGEFVRKMAKYLWAGWCPEKTLKGSFPWIHAEMLKWRFGAYHEYLYNSPKTIRDHGRVWREQHDFYKTRQHKFLTWERIPHERWPMT